MRNWALSVKVEGLFLLWCDYEIFPYKLCRLRQYYRLHAYSSPALDSLGLPWGSSLSRYDLLLTWQYKTAWYFLTRRPCPNYASIVVILFHLVNFLCNDFIKHMECLVPLMRPEWLLFFLRLMQILKYLIGLWALICCFRFDRVYFHHFFLLFLPSTELGRRHLNGRNFMECQNGLIPSWEGATFVWYLAYRVFFTWFFINFSCNFSLDLE